MQVVGAALEGNTIGISDVPLSKPTVVVLGNEGHGIRTNILKRCTHLLRIAGSSDQRDRGGSGSGDVDSLNVSVTGGIILHHFMQRKPS